LSKYWVSVSLLTLSLLLLSPDRRAQASVTWTGDFETGTIKQWSYFFTESQLKVVMTPVRAGKYALEATAKTTGDRVEVQHGTSNANEGAERYYGWSVMAPKPLGPNDHQTGYFESKQTYMQIMSFAIKGTDVSLDIRPPNSRRLWSGRGKFTTGVWHDFVIHIKWSKDAAVGFIELWFDGQKVLNQTPAQTLWDANGPFFQIGFLNGTAGEVVYVDEAREGTTLADVQLAPLVGGTGGSGGTAATGGSGGTVAMGGNGGTIAAGGNGGTAASGGTGGQMQTAGSSGEAGLSGQSGNAGSTAGAAGGEDAPTDSKKKSGGCALGGFTGVPQSRLSFVLVSAIAYVLYRRRRS
jgi:Polysaccharide lyase